MKSEPREYDYRRANMNYESRLKTLKIYRRPKLRILPRYVEEFKHTILVGWGEK